MANGKVQSNQSSDDKVKTVSAPEMKDGIEFYKGNTNILLIAPHGFESKPLEDLPLDDIGTAELTRQIRTHLGCAAIINPTFRKPTGNKQEKRNNGKPSFEAEVLNLNLLHQVKQHPLFRKLIKAVIKKEGLTYVFWIHGIDKSHIDSGIDCYMGCGQPNTKEEEKERFTADKETIDKVLNQLSKSGIRTVLAPEKSEYRGWSLSYMNQWLKLKGYDFAQAQSIQLEFRKTGIRGKDDIKSASKKIATAISAIIASDKPEATPNVKKSSGGTKIPADAPPEEITDPAETEGTIDENGPASSKPAGENTATETGIESTTEEETTTTKKMTTADDRTDFIDVGENASKTPGDKNAMVAVITEVEVVDEDPKVEEAYKHLKDIFVKHFQNAMLEVGQYLVQKMYGSYDSAINKESKGKESLAKLVKRIQENSQEKGNAPSRTWVYDSVNLAIDNHLYEQKKLPSVYGQLGHSHKVNLTYAPNDTVEKVLVKKALIKEAAKKEYPVAKLRERIREENNKLNPDHIPFEELNSEISMDDLKKFSSKRIELFKTKSNEQIKKIN